jgi:hypothetical protein
MTLRAIRNGNIIGVFIVNHSLSSLDVSADKTKGIKGFIAMFMLGDECKAMIVRD